MASLCNRLGVCALRGTSRARPRRFFGPSEAASHSFHQSVRYRVEKSSPSPNSQRESPTSKPRSQPDSTASEDLPASTTLGDFVNSTVNASTLESTQPASSPGDQGESLSSTLPKKFKVEQEEATPEEEARLQEFLDNPPPEHAQKVAAYKAELDALVEKLSNELERERQADGIDFEVSDDPPARRFKGGLLSMGEENEEEEGPDEPFEGNDITSLAHGELEQHREIRHYARIAAWEMPFLSALAKPFEPPIDTPLRFRYTSYMGENHPAERKVVLEFCTADLPLTPKQRLKLVKLVGVRYDPQRDLVKMSCEMFDTIAQNKRYLGDLVDTLIATSKGEGIVEGAKDDFEDIPVDFRHVKWNKKHEFPEKWKVTAERKRLLDERRNHRIAEEDRRISDGQLVDGQMFVEAAMSAPVIPSVAVQGGRKTVLRAPQRI